MKAAMDEIERQEALGREEGFTVEMRDIKSPASDNESIPYWEHPILVNDLVYVDNRAFKKNDVVFNRLENNLYLDYAAMELLWQKETRSMEPIIPQAAVVYGEWLSAGIVSRMAMDEMDRVKVRVGAIIFFVSMYLLQADNLELNKRNLDEIRLMVVRILVRHGEVPSQVAADVFDEVAEQMVEFVKEGNYMEGFTQAIVKVANTNIGNFTPRTVIQLMTTGSWIGTNAVLLSGTALFYPPTFIALVKNAISISTYTNKTRLGRATKTVGRRANPQDLVRFVEQVRADLAE
jgi:hypothetical protein